MAQFNILEYAQMENINDKTKYAFYETIKNISRIEPSKTYFLSKSIVQFGTEMAYFTIQEYSKVTTYVLLQLYQKFN